MLAVAIMCILIALFAIRPVANSKIFHVLVPVAMISIILLWSYSIFRSASTLQLGNLTSILESKRVRYVAYLLIACPLIFLFLAEDGDYEGRRSTIYLQSEATIQNSNAISQTLGRPVAVCWPISSSWSGTSESSTIDLSIPLSGSTAKGDLHVSGIRHSDSWLVTKMYLVKSGTNVEIPIM
jgi:hypothetical protein